jgi:hypothetical protein
VCSCLCCSCFGVTIIVRLFHPLPPSLPVSLLFSLQSCARFFLVASVGAFQRYLSIKVHRTPLFFLFSCVSFFFLFLLIHLPTLPRSFSLSHIPSPLTRLFFSFYLHITLFLSNSPSRSFAMDDTQTAFATHQYPPYAFDLDMMKVSVSISFPC